MTIALSIGMGGCAGLMGERNPLPAKLVEQARVPNIASIRYWADEVPLDLVAEMRTKFPDIPPVGLNAERVRGRQVLEVLALSGGGPNGAFGAGLLAGWSDRGTRPEFEVVTGVSAGAIIAPFAFLGPKYDAALREIWTAYQTRDLIRAAGLPGLLGGDSLVDTEPLAALMERYLTRELLAEIAREYQRGRVLLVLTTNLDAQRPVVWNMGAIAQRGTPHADKLFRDVIRASSALPGLFPPVRIQVEAAGETYDELHVDGGVSQQLFVAPAQAPLKAYNRLHRRPPIWRFYVVMNGKTAPAYEPVKQRTLQIAGRSIQALLGSQTNAELYQIWRWVRDGGGQFRYAEVPPTFPYKPVEAFDKAYQRKLFEWGEEIGRRGLWAKKPPSEVPTALRPKPVETRPATQHIEPQLFGASDFFGTLAGAGN
jgi:predicted acylesterase/phospholipase RssA